MSGDITIRDATPADLDAIAAVLEKSYEQYMPPDGAQISDDERAAWEGYRADIRDVGSRAATSTHIVAERDGEILGSVNYYAAGFAEPGDHSFPDDWTSIRLLGVDPSARGLGVGRMLMDACVRRARDEGAKFMGLHTTILMDVARAMYVRLGFVRAPEFDFFPMPDFTVEAYRLDL
jgi:ribosomal protein S18 acetylase RimI-like enzyme